VAVGGERVDGEDLRQPIGGKALWLLIADSNLGQPEHGIDDRMRRRLERHIDANDHPQLTAVDVRLRKTRGPIGLIRLKNRSLSPVAKLFLRAANDVVKTIRPAQLRAGAGRKSKVALTAAASRNASTVDRP
jgi:hypothetical protein